LTFLVFGVLAVNRPVPFVVVGGIRGAIPGSAGAGRGAAGNRRGCPLGLPVVSRHDLNELLPLAMACFVLAAVETSAIGRMFGAETRRPLRRQSEFALGVSNLVAGVVADFERRDVAVARQRARARARRCRAWSLRYPP
jgi:MFS superfamily sulfate permease-like transporter